MNKDGLEMWLGLPFSTYQRHVHEGKESEFFNFWMSTENKILFFNGGKGAAVQTK